MSSANILIAEFVYSWTLSIEAAYNCLKYFLLLSLITQIEGS